MGGERVAVIPFGLTQAPAPERDIRKIIAPFKVWDGDLLVLDGDVVSRPHSLSDTNCIAGNSADEGGGLYLTMIEMAKS